MPSLSSIKGRKSLPEAAILSPVASQHHEPLKAAPSTPQISDRRLKDINQLMGDDKFDVAHQDFNMDDLDDEVFDFEERGHNGTSFDDAADQDEEEDSSSTKSPASPIGGAPILSQYSRSPAQPIMRQNLEQQQAQGAGVGSQGIIGSYRGHPFSMPIVNEEMHEKIAAMGDVKSFVGSVRDGESASIRASYTGAASFTGAPRSFTERMIMEDFENEKRSNQFNR